VYVDPLAVVCPKCGAAVDVACTRVTGPYGMGQPLRRMHTDRFREAQRPIAELRRIAHQRRLAARRAQGR
jgi:hypothetical protein